MIMITMMMMMSIIVTIIVSAVGIYTCKVNKKSAAENHSVGLRKLDVSFILLLKTWEAAFRR